MARMTIALLCLNTVLLNRCVEAATLAENSQLQTASTSSSSSLSGLGTGLMSAVNCIAGSDNDSDVMDVPYDHTQFLVNIHNNFQYMQISLKIGSCSSYDIYRGNRFLTPDVLNLNSSKMQTIMRVAYARKEDGAHAYTISMESINYFDRVNTSISCGKLRGFRVKAKGASICDLRGKENKLGVRVGLLKTQPRDSSKNLHTLHRWTQGAYVMAICFTLTAYLLFLLALRILRSHTHYEFVISERHSPATEEP